MAPWVDEEYDYQTPGLQAPAVVVARPDVSLPVDVGVLDSPAFDGGAVDVEELLPLSFYDTFDHEILLPLCAGWYLLAGLVTVALYYIHLRIRFGPLLRVGGLLF